MLLHDSKSQKTKLQTTKAAWLVRIAFPNKRFKIRVKAKRNGHGVLKILKVQNIFRQLLFHMFGCVFNILANVTVDFKGLLESFKIGFLIFVILFVFSLFNAGTGHNNFAGFVSGARLQVVFQFILNLKACEAVMTKVNFFPMSCA